MEEESCEEESSDFLTEEGLVAAGGAQDEAGAEAEAEDETLVEEAA